MMHNLLRLTALAAGLGLGSATNSTSTLFSGATIIAWDDKANALDVIRNGSLLVVGDKIKAVNKEATPSSLPSHVDVIDVSGQIITPGFIDTHRHGWQTAFKTLASNTSLAEYFNRYGEFAAAASYGADDVYWGQLAGLYEALNAGVTTSLDHAHHTWSNATAYAGLNASIDSGARVVWAYAFHDIPSLNYTVADQLPNFREMADNADRLAGTAVTLGIAYDSWGPNPPPEARQVADLATEYDVAALTTHCLSGPWGVDNLPEDVAAFGVLNGSVPVVFSHGSFMTAKGAALLRATDQYLSITPESEMHYGHTHPHSFVLQDQAALGVDTHFTYSTDILTQARIWLQQARYHAYADVLAGWRIPPNNPMSVVQAFLLATRAGALALRRPDLGVIAPGAKADLVVWNARESPALLGWRDPVAAVMLHASVGDILHVTVDGRFVKRDGKITAPRYGDVRDRFQESAERIQKLWADTPLPALEGRFNGGYDFEKARVVDAERGEGDGYGRVYV